MDAVLCPIDATPAVSDKPPVPFASVYVTLTKQEHIRLVMDANSWKGLHRKATERAEWNERRHQHELLGLKQQASQRAELVMRATADRWRALRRRAATRAAGREQQHQEELHELKQQASQRAELVMRATADRWKALRRRAVARAAGREQRHQEELRELKDQAAQREAVLGAQLEVVHAKVRDLRQRLFGRKSESHRGSEAQVPASVARAPRGHLRGAPGHGRTMQPQLPQRIELVELDSPQCPSCGLTLGTFPGTDDSEVLEIEVQAYRRVIRRQRYRPLCECGCVPGIVSAPPPPRLIERGKYGVSVWTTVLLDKFLYGRPSHRLLQDLADHGLNMSPGTLAGGLQTLPRLMDSLNQALVCKLRSEEHWHADETRWAVFVTMQGKVGHRWYLWVFHSRSVVHYVLDPSRSTKVVQGELDGVDSGIISCDRYSAYKRFARLNPGVLLAFCWAHYLGYGFIWGILLHGGRSRRRPSELNAR
jgi:transposase